MATPDPPSRSLPKAPALLLFPERHKQLICVGAAPLRHFLPFMKGKTVTPPQQDRRRRRKPSHRQPRPTLKLPIPRSSPTSALTSHEHGTYESHASDRVSRTTQSTDDNNHLQRHIRMATSAQTCFTHVHGHVTRSSYPITRLLNCEVGVLVTQEQPCTGVYLT